MRSARHHHVPPDIAADLFRRRRRADWAGGSRSHGTDRQTDNVTPSNLVERGAVYAVSRVPPTALYVVVASKPTAAK